MLGDSTRLTYMTGTAISQFKFPTSRVSSHWEISRHMV